MGFPTSDLYNGQTHYQDGRLYSYSGDTGTWIHTVDMTPFHYWTCNMTGDTLMDWGLYPRSGRTSGTTTYSDSIYKVQRSADLTNGGYFLAETKSHTAYGNTFCCWFRTPIGAPQDGNGYYIGFFHMEDENGNHAAYEISIYYYGIRTINNIYASQSKSVSLPYDLDDNKWHHLCCTNTTKKANIYLDGVMLLDTTRGGAVRSFDNNHEICIAGARKESSDSITSCSSYTEDIRYYNRALTTYEVSVIYNKSYGTYNQSILPGSSHNFIPNIWVKMQETRENEYNICGEFSQIPITTGITTNSGISHMSGAWWFGEDDKCHIEHPNLTGNTQHSHCFWFKDESSSGNYGIWVETTGIDYADDVYFFIRGYYITHWDLVVRFPKTNNVSIPTIYLLTSRSWVGNWHHFCFVFDDTYLRFYYDGVFTSENIMTGVQTGPFKTSVDQYYIGSGVYNPSTPSLVGYMEDFRIYDYCLHPNEIKNIYNDGKGVLY